eukprot:170406-Ditylum_brightwellii.AAC.1
MPIGPPAKKYSVAIIPLSQTTPTLEYFPTLPATNLFIAVAQATRHLAQRGPSYTWRYWTLLPAPGTPLTHLGTHPPHPSCP